MNKQQLSTVLILYISYVFFGAVVYFLIEPEIELKLHKEKIIRRDIIIDDLNKYLAVNDSALKSKIFKKMSFYCKLDIGSFQEVWSFYHCLFFVLIMATTYGYGDMFPRTTFGRGFFIPYAVIGLPITMIILNYASAACEVYFLGIYDNFIKKRIKSQKLYIEWSFHIFGQFLIIFLPGLIIFMFLPAIVFSYFEKWDYIGSLYYAFVTLSTIGFGDFPVTFKYSVDQYVYFVLYEAFVLIWYLSGLIYMMMVNTGIISLFERIPLSDTKEPSITFQRVKRLLWRGIRYDWRFIKKFFGRKHEKQPKKTKKPVTKRARSCPNIKECNKPIKK